MPVLFEQIAVLENVSYYSTLRNYYTCNIKLLQEPHAAHLSLAITVFL